MEGCDRYVRIAKAFSRGAKCLSTSPNRARKTERFNIIIEKLPEIKQ